MIRLGVVLSFLFATVFSVSRAALLSFQPKHTLTQPLWAGPRPFWRQAEMQEKMHSIERTIVVSVKSEKTEQVHLTMKGAGIVRRKLGDAFRLATQFSRLKEWSPYFRSAQYDATSEQVAIEVGVWKFLANSLVQLQKTKCEENECILWEILAGTFKGLRGGMQFVADREKYTEISIAAEYTASSLPFPKSLTTMALEAVMQRVASSLREYVERNSHTD